MHKQKEGISFDKLMSIRDDMINKLADGGGQKSDVGAKEKAALELLRGGARFEVVQQVLGDDIDLKQLTKQFFDKDSPNR